MRPDQTDWGSRRDALRLFCGGSWNDARRGEGNPGPRRWGRCDEVAATLWATGEEAQRSALVCEYMYIMYLDKITNILN